VGNVNGAGVSAFDGLWAGGWFAMGTGVNITGMGVGGNVGASVVPLWVQV
jgi:hypothetical protein